MIHEFDGGRQTAIEWEELEPIVRRYFAGAPSDAAAGPATDGQRTAAPSVAEPHPAHR
jgi:hypothetical protein